MSLRPVYVGNWKMNKLRSDAEKYCARFLDLLDAGPTLEADIWLSVPLTCLDVVRDMFSGYEGANSECLGVGAQNVHWLESGAHTGEVSPAMLRDAGAAFALVGHSERRQYYGEDDEHVALRARAAVDAGLKAIVCVGESEADYRAQRTESTVRNSLRASLGTFSPETAAKLIVAYEPVWAIGSGLAATPEIACAVHRLIREELKQLFGDAAAERIRIIYGGSTNPDNIAALCGQQNVNGGLPGGASLDPETFYRLIVHGLSA